MKSILSRLADDWERTVLGIVCLVFLCFALVWALPRSDGGNTVSETALRQPASALGADAYSFLAPEQQQRPDGSALAFAYRAPQPPPPVKVKEVDPPPPEDPPGPETKDTHDGSGQQTNTSSSDAGDNGGTVAPPRPKIRTIRYLGIYEGTTGQRLAALTVRDPGAGTTRTRFLREGQVCEGIRIDSFDPRAVRLLVPGGAHATVERGGVHTVNMD